MSNYPGAHVKYAFDLLGITFEPFSCSVANTTVIKVDFEKAEPDNLENNTFWMTFNFGPISCLEKAISISGLLKEHLLDTISFELGVKVGEARLIEHNLIPRKGEGGCLHGIFPLLEMYATCTIEPYKLRSEDVSKILDSISKNISSEGKTLIKLFRHALNLDDIVARFIMFYLIVDIITSKNVTSSQSDIDNLICSIEPLTEKSECPPRKSPKRKPKENNQESCYSRLRNEINHRPVNHETTRKEIFNRIDDFKRIVKEAIQRDLVLQPIDR